MPGHECTLRQSSSSMIVFLLLLPFVLVEKSNVATDNIYFQFISELCDIVKLTLAPVISIHTILVLTTLIASHLREFKHLFPNKNIIPKQHYMVHFPSALRRFGPLTQVWCMRFEGKYHFVKQRIRGNPNFKNIEKAIADRCAMYECSLNVGHSHALFKNDLGVSSSVKSSE